MPSRAALEAYTDPYLAETLGARRPSARTCTHGEGIEARLALGFPVGGYQGSCRARLSAHLAASGITVR